MSAFGPKRTSLAAPRMSAFRGKADMTLCGAFDPKRHREGLPPRRFEPLRCPVLSLGGSNEAARIYQGYRWFACRLAVRCPRTGPKTTNHRFPSALGRQPPRPACERLE